MRGCRVYVLGLLVTLILPGVGQTVPQMMNYQGRLTDDSGNPITTATPVEFRIYNASSGGTQLWMESHSVTPDAEGLFSVVLGSVNSIPDSALAPTETYLGMTVGGDPELTPRVALLAAPYAVRVATIDGAKGGAVSGNIELESSTATTGNIYKAGSLFLHNYNNNIFMGSNAGNQVMTGSGNVGIGGSNLLDNTTGDNNTAVGFTGLLRNTNGIANSAFGISALGLNTSGNYNTAIGVNALHANTTGAVNTAVGAWADVTTGDLTNATAIGYNAKVDASNKIRLGNDDVTSVVIPAPGVKLGIGTNTPAQALDVAGTAKVEGFQMTTGSGDGLVLTSDASGVGTWQPAGGGSTSGWQDDGNAVRLSTLTDSVGIGTATPQANLHVAGKLKVAGGNIELDASTPTSGNIYKGGNLFLHDYGSNLFMGPNAGNLSMTGYLNTATGIWALGNNTTGVQNVAIGAYTLSANTTGNTNIAIGSYALMNNSIGYSNIAIGYDALNSSTDAYYNVALGFQALRANTTGSDNTALGSATLVNNTTGYMNIAIGAFALLYNDVGSSNIAIGRSAIVNNTVGSNNVACGTYTLRDNTSGGGNTAIGDNALMTNTTGNGNTASGGNALGSNTTGYYNSADGAFALSSNTTGTFNTAIGPFADVTAGNLTNATAIGYNAKVDASNKVRIGNTDVSVIEGQVAYTFSSDRNTKENFQPVDGEEVLNKIGEMNLTSWNYKDQDPATFRHYGPMAQEFFAAFGHDGVGQIGDSVTINSGDQAGILFVAVKALEQRTAEIAKVKAENATLKEELAKLKKAVSDLLAQSKASNSSELGMK